VKKATVRPVHHRRDSVRQERKDQTIMEEPHMSENLSSGRFSKTLGVSAIAGIALAFAAMPSTAADQIPPPPYQIAGMHGIGLSVVWDEAIRKALPPGIEPVKGMTGGINIYHADRGYVIGPYSAAYFYVDIEGFDTPEGLKGRWMLAGVYGPQPTTSAALKTYIGFPVRPGESRLEPTAEGQRAIGIVNGQDFVTAEVKSIPGSCEAGALLLIYPTLSPETEQIVPNKIPVVADFCKANLVSAKVTAPSGDLFAAYPIAKITGASEFRNGAAAIASPQSVGK
jgi:hypothetical protein